MTKDIYNSLKSKIEKLIEQEELLISISDLKDTREYHKVKQEAYLEIMSVMNGLETGNLKDNLSYEIKEIGLMERKEIENLIRRNKSDILELEEIIVSKLGEGLNLGLFIEGRLIGFILSSYDTLNELYGNVKVLEKVNKLKNFGEDILLISDLLIDKKYRRNGLGLILLKSLLLKYKNNLILIVGRNESNGKRWQAENLVKSVGFKFLLAEKGFWNQVSIEEDYECGACKVGCKCEMVLRYLNLPDVVKVSSNKELITSEGK